MSELELPPGLNEVVFSPSRISCLFMQIHRNQLTTVSGARTSGRSQLPRGD